MNSVTDIWENVLRQLRGTLSETTIATWFDELTIVDIKGSTCYLHCASDFKRGYLESLFLDNIRSALHDLFSTDFEVKILDDAGLLEFQGGPAPKKQAERFTYAEFTFETFVVGPSNKLAHAASMAVAEHPAQNYNPLLIYGDSGLGKTHLLYAIANVIRRSDPASKIVYIKGDEFINEFIELVRSGRGSEFRAKYREADLLLVDDVQFVAGKEQVQNEFFHTFNTLYEAKKQIVLTSDRPPKDIATLEDRLKTRFEWGLTADVQAPEFETRVAIIRRKAESFDFDIPENVCEYMANKLKNNIRQLEGAVKKLRAFHLLENRPVNIATAQTAISDIINNSQPTPVTVEKIIEEVARTYQVTPEDICSQKRNAAVSKSRQVAMYVVREITQMPMVEIGQTFGGRDHSTVVYALRQMEDRLERESHTRDTVNDIIKNIRDR